MPFADELIELYCECDAEVSARRFLDRTRHPGHLDNQRNRAELLAWFVDQQSLGPLGAGRLHVVNTLSSVNYTSLCTDLRF